MQLSNKYFLKYHIHIKKKLKMFKKFMLILTKFLTYFPVYSKSARLYNVRQSFISSYIS